MNSSYWQGACYNKDVAAAVAIAFCATVSPRLFLVPYLQMNLLEAISVGHDSNLFKGCPPITKYSVPHIWNI